MSLARCAWVPLENPNYVSYHDTEWGVPVYDDRLLFEFLVLEGAQAGLSWGLILRKRDHYRQVFDGFDIARVAEYDTMKVETLMQDAGIVRNRRKVAAAIQLATVARTIQQEWGSLASFLWSFVDGHTQQPSRRTMADIPKFSPEAENMSIALRARGASFIGPTICYGFMQAVGMVNDHTVDCFRHEELQS